MRLKTLIIIQGLEHFNPRTSCEVRHFRHILIAPAHHISIHAPRVRCDKISELQGFCFWYFNPRTSCEVRPPPQNRCVKSLIFQSTHLVWGATLIDSIFIFIPFISIHAPRVRCDIQYPRHYTHMQYFNPRTSCEVRPKTLWALARVYPFQSTHLVWGATIFSCSSSSVMIISIHAPRVRCDVRFTEELLFIFNFNPRTSCEVRLLFFLGESQCVHFNPRTSCEVRLQRFVIVNCIFHFNPRTSCEVRPPKPPWNFHKQWISIHAPRVRCDFPSGNGWILSKRISIHAPRVRCDIFLTKKIQHNHISIHAPRVRCDSRNHCSSVQRMYFNPRTSCEVRPEPTSLNPIAKLFQSTHLVWGATYRFSVRYIALDISIHAPRVRCDKKISCSVWFNLLFQSTHLVWGATHIFYRVRGN